MRPGQPRRAEIRPAGRPDSADAPLRSEPLLDSTRSSSVTDELQKVAVHLGSASVPPRSRPDPDPTPTGDRHGIRLRYRARCFLIGGGWDPAAGRRHYGALLAACDTARPQVACVVLDEGDGTEQFGRWAGALSTAGPCDPVPVLVAEGGALDVGALGDADAVLVCGGLTPAYAAALAPARQPLREVAGPAAPAVRRVLRGRGGGRVAGRGVGAPASPRPWPRSGGEPMKSAFGLTG